MLSIYEYYIKKRVRDGHREGQKEKWRGSVKSCIFLTIDINIQTLIDVISMCYNAVFSAFLIFFYDEPLDIQI